MKLTTQCVTWALLVFVTAGLVETTSETQELDEVLENVPFFANALYSRLTKVSSSSNIFFSPLSIHFVLSLAYLGAKGKTAQQMATGLHLPASVEVVKKGFEELLQDIAKSNDIYQVELANKVYLKKGSNIKPEFEAVAMKSFHAEVEDVDFSSGENAAKIINEWVEKATHGKIKNIISKENITPYTMNVLVNAVHFKALWEYAFDKKGTRSSKFHVTAKETKNVQMMHNKGVFALVENNEIGADILELPYKNQTLGLAVILPFKIDGLSEVENKLQSANLKTIFKHFNLPKTQQEAEEAKQVYHDVDVRLPKFKLEEMLDLNDHLKALGMDVMFGNSADFSGITYNATYVSQVVHKAFIEVNEEGTEASAATSAGGFFQLFPMAQTPPTPFVADHPFIFLLRCRITGSVVFMGRLVDPY